MKWGDRPTKAERKSREDAKDQRDLRIPDMLQKGYTHQQAASAIGVSKALVVKLVYEIGKAEK